MSQFNIQDEYAGFLDLLEKHISEPSDEPLAHYGIKGMKWGVRKDRTSSTPPLKSLGPDQVVRKTASGETITLSKDPPSRFQRFMGRRSSKFRENYANQAYLSIRDGSGKKIGEAQVSKKNQDELNLVWLGINKSARGRGYATAVMKAGAEFGRQEGFKKLTLEVPGNSPDARHIYEKLGFKVVKEPTAKEVKDDIVFGGLTEMAYEINDTKHSEKGLGAQMSYSDKPATPDELLHYGIKGMKWGVRKDRPEGVSRSTNKAALKDAREFARAKMFYGEGAGTRRKLIKAKVESLSKRDPSYKKAFDHHLTKQDMAVHASKARRERKRKNVANSTAKTTRGISHYLRGNPQYASAAAAMLAGGALWAHKNGVDKAILKAGKTALSSLKNANNIKPGMSASEFLKNF